MNIDYKKTSLTISNSILKYFGIKPFHETLSELDKILDKGQYKNVVLLVMDGLGSFNLKDNLSATSFLRKNKMFDLSTVFPPTTAAATTSLLTGLTPSEHNYIGWDMYFKDSNEIISVFLNKTKYENANPKLNIKDRDYMCPKTLIDLINETGYKAYYAYPFDESYPCYDINDVLKRIIDLTNEKDKKFIYGYVENPDKLMHKKGVKSKEVREIIEDLNNKVEEFASKVKDTLIIVTADHGLIDSKFISLEKYKDFYDLIEWTSIEPRALGIKLKNNASHFEFENLYKKYFKNDFMLLTKEEALQSSLFGSSKGKYLEDTIGDYLMIGLTDISLCDIEFPKYKANHAGSCQEELTVPFILIDRK